MKPEDLISHIESLGANGSHISYALDFAAKCVAIAADRRTVSEAYARGVERASALKSAREAMRKACPHPKDLRDERDGGFDHSGVAWCTVYFCAACGSEVEKP